MDLDQQGATTSTHSDQLSVAAATQMASLKGVIGSVGGVAGSSQDFIVCGSCQADFKLANLMEFIEHKIHKCIKLPQNSHKRFQQQSQQRQDNENSSEVTAQSTYIFKCLTCGHLFRDATVLIEHCESLHSIKICKKFNKTGGLVPSSSASIVGNDTGNKRFVKIN